MGHKTDLRRYSTSIDAVARARAASATQPSPEIEMRRRELGILEIPASEYPGRRPKSRRTWLVVEF